jgi:isopentenyl phosphate kinase
MELVFLKLGGSVITDKSKPLKTRPEELKRLGKEIAEAVEAGGLRLLVGNGGGSYAHYYARQLLSSRGEARARLNLLAAKVRWAAARLNGIVVRALISEGLPAFGFSPSASAVASGGEILAWDLGPLTKALQDGVLPVIHGDVLLDLQRGFSILSTERLFRYLARRLRPTRVIVGTDVDGVYDSDPNTFKTAKKFDAVTAEHLPLLSGAHEGRIDVTGGMRAKVLELLELSRETGIECEIVNALRPGFIMRALLGERGLGTVVAWA